MSEIYFDDRCGLYDYLKETLEMIEEDYEELELEEYEETPYKSERRCSGFLYNSVKDVYYYLYFDHNYEWGSSSFNIDPQPLKKTEWEETIVMKKVKYTPA